MTQAHHRREPMRDPMRHPMPASSGCFFFVVGPSGAGKDSLMDGARQRLSGKPFVFAKRVITRPPGMIGEDYQSCDPDTFATRKAQGDFLITWQAHGYDYGLERTLLEQQANGKHIVANGSRCSVDAIRQVVTNLVVIFVTAPTDLLAERLAKRGRETLPEIKQRLARQARRLPEDVEVITVHNDASLTEGVDRFTEILQFRGGKHS